MKHILMFCVLAMAALTAGAAAQQPGADDLQALRARIEERYDVVPLTDGVALTPKTRRGDVRLIEVGDAIAINGTVVSGRELRERLGADADEILRLSYMEREARQALFRPSPVERDRPQESERRQEPAVEAPRPAPAAPEERRSRRANGDRVRIFGDVTVHADEEVTGQAVAVFGSVRVDGEVGDQVVAVLGSVELGPNAVVDGDIVSVGGRVRRAEGAQVRGGVTEVSFADADFSVHLAPWLGGIGLLSLVEGFGAVPRLIGSTFRLLLLVFLAVLALVLARRTVEGSAQRVSDNPVKATLVGLAAELLLGPILFITAVVLAISIIGIPLLLLLPFVVLFLVVLALLGFAGTAAALGQWTRRRFGISTPPGIGDVVIGVVIILAPLMIGRLVALGGWPASPIAFLLVASGVGLEFLAWSTGFGAVLTNAFGRWQANRAARATTLPAPPAVP